MNSNVWKIQKSPYFLIFYSNKHMQYADRIKMGIEPILIYEIFDNLTIRPVIRAVSINVLIIQ